VAGCGGAPPERQPPVTSEAAVHATVTACGRTVEGTVTNVSGSAQPYVQVVGRVMAGGTELGTFRWTATDVPAGAVLGWRRIVPGVPARHPRLACPVKAANGLTPYPSPHP
jgi:hypothetical protein